MSESESQFHPVSLSSLKDCFKDLAFDLYLLMPTGKYLKAFDRQTGLDFNRLAAYEAKGVQHFHVAVEDVRLLDEHLSRSPMLTLSNTGTSLEAKKRAFITVMEQTLFEAFSQGSPSQALVTKAFEALKANLQSDKDFLDTLRVLLELCPKDDTFIRHAIGTSIYSYIIANLNGMTSERSLKIIIFSSMFHDIGRFKLPEVRRRSYQNPSAPELAEFRRHPQLTLDTFSMTLPFADEEIRTTIIQHRERLDGKGYPNGLKGTSVHILARILAIGDALSELTLGMEDGTHYTKSQALTMMMADEGRFDKKLLTPFANVILQSEARRAA